MADHTQERSERTTSGPAMLESVTVVFRLLDEIAAARRSMGVTELANILSAPKPRVYRYLTSMRRLGIVEQDMQNEKYRLGARLVKYGEAANEQFDLRALAEPYLTRIRDATGQTALLSVATHDTALVVSTAESLANVCVSVKPGNRLQPYCSAQGRTVLAFTDPASQQLVMRRKMPALTEKTMTSPLHLAHRLELIRERLWDDADGEVALGINVLCCPVFREQDRIVGTLGIVGSSANIPSPPPKKILWELQAAAAELSEYLNSNIYNRVTERLQQQAAEPAGEC